MKIKRFIGGSLLSNGYVLYGQTGGTCYIIDPGYQPKKFINFVKENQLTPRGIILTHLHHDHVGAAEAVRDALECSIFMHEEDAFVYKGVVDQRIKAGDTFELDDEVLEVLHTPGHTRGSICIMGAKSRVCFTGDTIFDTDLGRTDLAGGSEADMKRSICEVVDLWENDIMIYPGHDDGCTMKKVRIYNTEFLALRDGNER
ncbi:Probable polyketide biosynthesis zinc-dependent hydrolase BaeB [uncultured Eubacterium sp.]|uniref:MBL fold metallo-hydrolase n=1 Tax=Emergencia sp. TaxID=1926557 RepID=UPI00082285C8|nr:Probable polyketide biosynthesis zinc-dependent hydrolase BaeB [uncultured Eubacterium sp.]